MSNKSVKQMNQFLIKQLDETIELLGKECFSEKNVGISIDFQKNGKIVSNTKNKSVQTILSKIDDIHQQLAQLTIISNR